MQAKKKKQKYFVIIEQFPKTYKTPRMLWASPQHLMEVQTMAQVFNLTQKKKKKKKKRKRIKVFWTHNIDHTRQTWPGRHSSLDYRPTQSHIVTPSATGQVA